MTTPLEEIVSGLREAAEKATPGEWYPGHFGSDSTCQCRSIVDDGRYMGAIATVHMDNGLPIGEGGNDAPPAAEAVWNMRLIARANPQALLSVLDAFQAQAARIKHLEAMLFPYANATEISGVSWDGKYLIGDKASISFFHEMKNRGEQIDVYRRAYDERMAAAERDLAAAVEERDAIKADKERLDFLERLNIGLNDRYGTAYRWKMVVNHNVNRLYLRDINTIDINDAQANGLRSCREAIDEQMRAAKGPAK